MTNHFQKSLLFAEIPGYRLLLHHEYIRREVTPTRKTAASTNVIATLRQALDIKISEKGWLLLIQAKHFRFPREPNVPNK